jgi:hypothetical protein
MAQQRAKPKRAKFSKTGIGWLCDLSVRLRLFSLGDFASLREFSSIKEL